MEGLVLYTARKIHEIRFGIEKNIPLCSFSELKTWSFWKALLAEFLGTLLFVFLGTQSTIPLDGIPQPATKVAFAFGLGIFAVVQIFGNISGCNVNPAVSIALAAVGRITPVRAFFYIIFQVGGGITGSFILKGVTDAANHNDLGVNKLGPGINIGQGIGVELIMTFVLVFVVMATTDPDRPDGGSKSIAAGLTVAGLVLTGIEYSSTSVNPARSLAAAVASNNFVNVWVYWVGPISGGLLASLSYHFIFCPYKQWKQPIEPVEKAVHSLVEDDGPILVPKEYFNH